MKIITKDNYIKENIGTKARNLFLLKSNGINVPNLICIEQEYNKEELERCLEHEFEDVDSFAVRSSGLVEDSNELSFAGQFNTYLDVKRKDICFFVDKCISDSKSKRLDVYYNSDSDIKMNVIVQEQIKPDISGVMFTSNPQGILNEIVIVVGRGLGENIVTDKVDTTSYYYNITDKKYYYEKQNNSYVLNKNQIERLIETSKKIEEILGDKLDIEFCFKDDVLYILQTRKITTLNSSKKIILDNSNIVESYPGITLPLTQDFIKQAYYIVFKGVLQRLTNNDKIVKDMDNVVSNIIQVANGRVYYEIDNFYTILKLLPFEKKIIPIWQEMLGVENKEIDWNRNIKVSKIVKLNIIRNFFKLLKSNIKEMEELSLYFKEIEDYYKEQYREDLTNKELLELYKILKDKVSLKWYITLVNDMYAFIYTAMVKRQLKKEKISNYEDVANRLISNLTNLESMKPIEELVNISKFVKENNMEQELNYLASNNDFYEYIKSENVNEQFKELILNYIDKYGDRNVEELKLESKTFRTDPIILIRKIIEYSNEEKLDINCENKNLTDFSNQLLKYLSKAENGIRYREKSRLARSKLYGFMRNIVLHIGKNLVADNRLSKIDDVFYLRYDELISCINNKEMGIKRIISDRKLEYNMYSKIPAFSRLIFSDKIVNKVHQNINNEIIASDNNKFMGVPCSSGIVTAEVIIVDKNNIKNINTSGKIIVTEMTDPGWVYLIAKSVGLIAQKGSILSHSAIISRELGKPAVVGVKNITNILKTGDIVKLDATNGIIEVIK